MDSKPITETQNKLNTAVRYLGSNVSAVLASLVVLGALDPATSDQVIGSFRNLYKELYDVVGALGNIWVLIFPILSAVLLKMGVDSSGFASMVNRALAAAKGGDETAAKVIVNAAASTPGTTAVINPKLGPDPGTLPNVVAALPPAPPSAPAPPPSASAPG